jgi:hypothetical protein
MPEIVYKDGSGLIHREDGPAIIHHDGDKSWLQNSQYHRLDGPAKEWYADGFLAWFINGYDVTDEIHQWAVERDIDLNNLSELDKCAIIMEWSNYER